MDINVFCEAARRIFKFYLLIYKYRIMDGRDRKMLGERNKKLAPDPIHEKKGCKMLNSVPVINFIFYYIFKKWISISSL